MIIFFNLLVVDTKKGAIYLTVNRSQTAFAIIRHLKPRKFKDVHLNKSPMSALNNDGVSRLVVSQIVARLYTQHQDRGLLSVMLLPISGFKIII